MPQGGAQCRSRCDSDGTEFRGLDRKRMAKHMATPRAADLHHLA
jgi:hypothetical protein